MASEQQGSHSSGQTAEITELQPQDKQKSDSPDLANTIVELNQTISHMGIMLGEIWQKSQDKDLPSQQPDVDESQQRRRGKKRSRSSSSHSEPSSSSKDDSRLATIAENRWNKKLAPEKLKLIHDKYKRPGNCPTVCQMTVNPEIFAQLPYYQQRADLNVSKIQDSVQKTALITLQSAQTVTNTKSEEFDAVKKQLSEQQVDSFSITGPY